MADLSDDQIQARLAAIPPIQAKLTDAVAALTPRLVDADARLAQLGPAPGPGQPAETSEIAKERRALTEFHQMVDGEIKQSNLLQVEAAQLAVTLTHRRQQQLNAQLWTHGRSILDPRLWTEFVAAAPADTARMQSVFSDEGAAIGKAARSSVVLGGWIAAAIVALLMSIPLRIWLNRRVFLGVSQATRGRLRRTLLALARVLVATFTVMGALVLLRTALGSAGAITPVFEQLTPILIRVLVFAAFFEGLGGALLAPSRPGWRLAPIPDDVVARLRAYPTIIAMAAATAAFVRGSNTILGVSAASSAAFDSLTAMLELLAIGAALATISRARNAHFASQDHHDAEQEAESRLPWIAAALVAWLTLAAAMAAELLGYLQLAFRLMSELVWVATVAASLFLLLRFVDEVFPAVLSPDRPIGRFLRVAIGLSKGALDQISVLAAGACRLTLLLFGWAAILAPFGAGASDVFSRLTSSQLVYRVGQVSISPGTVLGAIALFVVGMLVTRAVRGWLEQSYLPKTRMDLGLRASLSTGVTYLGGLLALLLTCAYLGVDFNKIALLASALSVGIGFGLQAVIGNFVSGLILLAERPIRVGDWIAIGDLEGDVKRINARATEIEMPDRSKLIVPNSDLISKVVRNVTHTGSLGRVKIVLKTADSADPMVVRDLVLSRMTAHPDILDEPAPSVFLNNIADGALEFTCFAYVAAPRAAYGARSELLFQIVPALREKGIPLANSTPIVNVGLGERTIEPGAGAEP